MDNAKFWTHERLFVLYIALLGILTPMIISGVLYVNSLGDRIESLEQSYEAQKLIDTKQNDEIEENKKNADSLEKQLWNNNELMDERVDELEK